MRNKIADSWCISEGFDCPGICFMWSSRSLPVHWLDLAGLCEPDWWLCNPGYEQDIALAKSNSQGWKINQKFTKCPAPLEKPCAAYWDRKNRWSYKVFFRLVIILHIITAVIWMATSLMKKRS